jgi:hypothetical protein
LAGSVVGLDDDVALGLDVVLGQDRADGLGGVEDELVGLGGGGVVELGDVLGVLGLHDRDGLVARAAGKTLPQVLGDERHDGVDQGQGTLESSVESLLGRLLGLGRGIVRQQVLGVLEEHITQLRVPVLVGDLGRVGEITLLENLVHLLSGGVELVQNPALGKRFIASLLNTSLGLEVITQLAEDELGGLVDLVTELTVAVNDLDIESDVTSCKSLLANRI